MPAPIERGAMWELFQHWDKTGEWLSTQECADLVEMKRRIIYQNLVRYERSGQVSKGFDYEMRDGKKKRVVIWKKA